MFCLLWPEIFPNSNICLFWEIKVFMLNLLWSSWLAVCITRRGNGSVEFLCPLILFPARACAVTGFNRSDSKHPFVFLPSQPPSLAVVCIILVLSFSLLLEITFHFSAPFISASLVFPAFSSCRLHTNVACYIIFFFLKEEMFLRGWHANHQDDKKTQEVKGRRVPFDDLSTFSSPDLLSEPLEAFRCLRRLNCDPGRNLVHH